ncbi:hypothetical protein BC941DRAFT_429107 [Chlamydoabsidia padenii]|nr:hypothetical protein BC941DRAFT_429107 [Chlamydoabsidia padenii]
MIAHPIIKTKRTAGISPGHTSDATTSNIPSTPEPVASLNNQHIMEPPSRHHWKPDSEASHCGYPGCTTSFGLFDRRHHCRRCGNIYCAQHCSSYFKLDQDCRFHHQGILSRGCDSCELDYHSWLEGNSTTTNKSSSQLLQKQQSSIRTLTSINKRHPGIMTQQPHAMEGVTDVGKEDIVSPSFPSKNISIINKQNDKKSNNTAFNPIPSVPADWQWSTF